MKKKLSRFDSVIKYVIPLMMVIGVLLLFPKNTFAVTKRVDIDLTHQHLYAYEDNTLQYDFLVSTGRVNTPTPNGTFWPGTKLRFDRMIGGSRANGTYYDLPNVPYVVYIYNQNYPVTMGYSIHGTYWHNNFGHPMSHGCINVKISDMEKLYSWIDNTTEIRIYGTTP